MKVSFLSILSILIALTAQSQIVVTSGDTLVYSEIPEWRVNANDTANFNMNVFDADTFDIATALQNEFGSTKAGWKNDLVINGDDTSGAYIATSWFKNPANESSDWLIYGPITMPSTNVKLSWNHKFSNSSYRNGYEVLFSYDGDSIQDFSEDSVLFRITDNDTSTASHSGWKYNSEWLAASRHAGKPMYIAFHHKSQAQFVLSIRKILMIDLQSNSIVEDQIIEYSAWFENGKIYVSGLNDSHFIQLFDINGKSIVSTLNTAAESQLIEMNASQLTPGIYLLNIDGQSQRIAIY